MQGVMYGCWLSVNQESLGEKQMGEGNQGAEPVPCLRRGSCPLAIAKGTPGLHHLYINQGQKICLSTQGQLFLLVISTILKCWKTSWPGAVCVYSLREDQGTIWEQEAPKSVFKELFSHSHSPGNRQEYSSTGEDCRVQWVLVNGLNLRWFYCSFWFWHIQI